MARRIDFDQARNEVEGLEDIIFTIRDEEFKVSMANVDAGAVLAWMEGGGTITSIPRLLRVFFDEDDYKRLLGTGLKWHEMQRMLVELAMELGGNALASSMTSSDATEA